jgi:imidazolonepropionase-like amidohydrolase
MQRAQPVNLRNLTPAEPVYRVMQNNWLITATVGAVIFCSIGPSSGAQFPPSRPLALVGGTVFSSPADSPIQDATILIRDGKISAIGRRPNVEIPAGTEILNCAGSTITAGLWNSHVHFMERKWINVAAIPAAELAAQIEAMLTRFGFTSVFDTGSMWDNTRRLRDRIESDELLGPRIRSTGEILVPRGGVPPDLVFDITGAMRMKIPEVTDQADAIAAARQHLDAGTDGIKVYAATWARPIVSMSDGTIRAVADEAHRRNKLAFAHPSNRDGLLAAIRGGVDVIVHTAPQMGPWDPLLIAEMMKARITLIPTLKLWRHELKHDRISARERFVAVGVEQLRAWRAAGVFGTDVGYMADYDRSDEYALMADAGMDFRQILASLTTVPAERFGDSDRLGRVTPRMMADLTVFSGDPSRDVRAFAAVQYTIRGGRVIYPIQWTVSLS